MSTHRPAGPADSRALLMLDRPTECALIECKSFRMSLNYLPFNFDTVWYLIVMKVKFFPSIFKIKVNDLYLVCLVTSCIRMLLS